MLVIRLQRTGRSNLATYRIVVAHKSRPVKGKFVEILGHYLPQSANKTFECKKERFEHWVAKGAQPSDTLARLCKRAGYKNMDSFIAKYTKQRSKSAPAEEPAAPAAPAASAPEPVAEAPTEPAPEAPAESTGEAPAA